jgi:transcriptional regulator with XRE-family HTH domain
VSFVSLQESLRRELRERIRERKLTGMDLARRTGFTQAHVSNFLNGKRGLKLTALDRMLKAVGLTVYDLLDPRALERFAAVPGGRDAEHGRVPLVDAREAGSGGVVTPAKARQFLRISRAFLDRLRPALLTSARKSWTRFVAIQVDGEDAAAMAPRLLPRARLLLDRHYNSLQPYRKDSRNIYAVRKPRGLVVRYVELVGSTLVLRPHNPEASVDLLPVRSGSYGEIIIGRVAQILVET